MAVSGLPEPCAEQALCIARLALDMMDLSMEVAVDGVSVVNHHISIRIIIKENKVENKKTTKKTV